MLLRRALVLAACWFVLQSVPSHAIDWQIETVDDDGLAGTGGSIALDSHGIPHIVYKADYREIRYATEVAGSWSVQPTGATGNRGRIGTIVMPGDVPAFTHGGLFFVKASTQWSSEDMVGGFWCSAVALAPDGSVWGTSQTQIYVGWVFSAIRRGNTWDYDQTLANTVRDPIWPCQSIVVDTKGNPHVCFNGTSGEPLVYGHRENDVWSTEELPPGSFASICIDAVGSPRISYYDLASKDLMLASHQNGTWVSKPIDTAGDVGSFSWQAVNNGVSYIVYYDKTNGNLKLATVTSSDQSTTTTIDIDGDVGEWSSIAIDANGRLHVAYHDITRGALKYAVGESTLPVHKATLGQIKSLYRKQ